MERLARMIRRYPALRPLLTTWALHVQAIIREEGACYMAHFGPDGTGRLLENEIGPWTWETMGRILDLCQEVK